MAEFDFLQRNIEWFTARQEEKSVSLNFEERSLQRDTDKDFREVMDEERKALRDNKYAFTEFLLTPPEDEEEEPADLVSITDDLGAETIVNSADVEALDEALPEGDIPADLTLADDTAIAAGDGAEEEEEEEPAPTGFARLDIHLREALRVLVDAVVIGQQPQFAERIPLTARTTSSGG